MEEDKLYRYNGELVAIYVEGNHYRELVTVITSDGKFKAVGREMLEEIVPEDNAKLNITSEEQEE